jgi:hypothetical protein
MPDASMIQEDEEQRLLRSLSQHLVAMCGSFIHLNEKGEPSGQPTFYSYTGTIIEILGRWCIATAGHCLHRLEEASKHPRVLIESQILADYFGANATNLTPIPFKPLEQGFLYADSDGLDFGLVIINDLWKQNLERNGIVPFTSKQWNFPSTIPFESFGIIGFPDDDTGGCAGDAGIMFGHVRPSLVPLRRLDDDTTKPFRRFAGEIIDQGNQKSIKGMSGGPILGFFRENGESKYLLIALQSSWDGRRIAFACPMPVLMKVLEAKCNNYLASTKAAGAKSAE